MGARLAAADLWRQLAEKAAGRGLDELASRTAEGVALAPLYQPRAEQAAQPWRPGAAWSVAQRIDHPDPTTANELLRLDLRAGADALVLIGAASPYARGFGLDRDKADLDLVLADVDLDRIGLRLDAGADTPVLLDRLATLVGRRHLASARLAVDVGFDPIGNSARSGNPTTVDLRRLVEAREKAGLAGTLFLADGRPYHEGGAGEAQELAAVLATAVAYLRQGERFGLAAGAAGDQIALLLAADADVVVGLAKFRAIRRLWARVETACGLEAKPVRLLAETSWRMMTRRDPWTNAMRAAAGAFAAGLGGADVVTVLPFTLPLGLPDAAARRLARNTQIVLLEEAHLGKVADPAAGAGAFETLTEDLAARAWHLFQEIEREGGIERSLQDGRLQKRIDEVAARRATEITTLRRGVVGTSRYANLAVPSVDVLEVRPRPEAPTDAGALPVRRDAAAFEALRDTAEGIATVRERPRVFLATLGSPAAFGPRAAYAANFFAAAGLIAETEPVERDLDTLVADFRAGGSAIACICGADAAYSTADALAAKLRQAGAHRVLMVGKTAGDERVATIDAHVHDGCDALAILADLLEVVMNV